MAGDEPKERLERFLEAVKALNRGRWLVLTHDNPDPDAIAAADILALLLRRLTGARATIAFGGIIGRAENQQMVRQLHLRLSHVRHISWKHYAHFALVDTQPQTGNNQLPEGIVPDLVFDHHPMRKATAAVPHADIRIDYGATATIVGEHLLASGLDITRRSATALVYAIRSETQDFLRESAGPDKRLYDRLFPLVDKRALAKIQTPRLPLSYFRNLHDALENLEGVDTLVISHLREVEQPDIIPEVADLLLRLEGKTWSLCTGLYGERVYMSVRTTNPRANAGRLVRRILGRRGKGGGHGMLAGGWLAFPNSAAKSGPKTPEELQRLVAVRLARALRKSPDRIAPIEVGRPKPPADDDQPEEAGEEKRQG